jgi:hypothetical protein
MLAWSTPEGCDPFRASVGPQLTADAHPRDRRAMKHLKLGSGGIPSTKGLVTFVGLLTSSLEALHPPPNFSTALLPCVIVLSRITTSPALLQPSLVTLLHTLGPSSVRQSQRTGRYQFGSRRLSVDPAFASTEVSPGSHRKTSKAAYDVCTPQSCYSGSSMDGNRDSFGLDCPPDIIPRARNALNKRKCPAACVRAGMSVAK